MLKTKRKEIILGILLVAIVVAWWHNLGGGGETAGPAGQAGGGPVARVNLADIKLPGVNWAAFKAPRPAYDLSGRNIFKWNPPPVAAPRMTMTSPAGHQQDPLPPTLPEQVVAPQVPQLPAQAVQTPAQELEAQAAAYSFIGYIGPPDRKTAVLYDANGPMFIHQGDVLGGRLRILEIGYESLTVGSTDPRFAGATARLPMHASE